MRPYLAKFPRQTRIVVPEPTLLPCREGAIAKRAEFTMDGDWIFSIRISLILCLLGFIKESVSVAVTQVSLVSPLSYVVHGEAALLNCHFLIEPTEIVTEVEWERNGVLVYLWLIEQPPKAFDVLEGLVDLEVESPSTLSIREARMSMDGTYTCRVRTNGKTAQNDMHLMVIVDACKESAWKTHSDRIGCTESVSMHCIGIYPKPSPACGVYSEKTGRFLNSVPFDSTNKLPNGTFEVSFNRRFAVADWLNHTDLSFRCHMMMLGTTWRSGIKHAMFGAAGCLEDPPRTLNGRYNMTENKSCWGYPAEDSVAEYSCDEGYALLGAPLLTCTDGKWVADAETVSDYAYPVCSDLNASHRNPLDILGLILTIVMCIAYFP